MLRSDQCNYGDVNIAIKETISTAGTNSNNQTNKELAFLHNVPFGSHMSKLHNTFIDKAEDSDTVIVMPMYNPLEYIEKYCMA